MTELSPWDFVNAITVSKEDLMKRPGAAKAYLKSAFVINRHLSYFADTVLHANEMNFYHNASPERQFHYLIAAVNKGRRYVKWGKPENKEQFLLVREYFQYGPRKAREVLRVLNSLQLQTIQRRKEANVTSQQ